PAPGARFRAPRRCRRPASRSGPDSIVRVLLFAGLLFGALIATRGALADDADWIAVKGASAERVRVPVFGGDVVLYRAGKRGAEPVILIHGLSRTGARDWAQVIPALAGNYDVYALDLPGFGGS